MGSKILLRMISGSTRSIGLPLSLIVPLPALQIALAVAFFFLPKVWTYSDFLVDDIESDELYKKWGLGN